MDKFFEEHFPTLVTALLGLLAWANEKRKLQKVEGDTFKIMQKAYETFAKDTNEKYIELKAELSIVRKELEAQKIENRKLVQELEALRNGVHFSSNAGKYRKT